MSERIIAGVSVTVDSDGYFTQPGQWTKEIAEVLAKELNITLTEKHFQLMEFLRKAHEAGEVLTIRKVGNSGIVDIKEFYQLFPGGPLKNASKIAGIPKPTSCV
jgi:dissimilatory sulfite reductase related protein